MRSTLFASCAPALACALLVTAAGSSASAQTFYENFNNNSQGWTLDASWQIGPATQFFSTQGFTGFHDPGFDADGITAGGVAGVNIGGAVNTTIHPMFYLTSPVVNTTGWSNVQLGYSRWMVSDYPNFMHNSVEVFDGTNWQVVSAFPTNPPVLADTAWTPFSFDVSAFSNANLQVRFGYDVGSAGVFSVGGWNLDNVSIAPAPGAAAMLGLGGLMVTRRRRG